MLDIIITELKNLRSNADGLFVCSLSKEGELVETKTYEIPVEVLNQYVSNRTKKKIIEKIKKVKLNLPL